MAGPSRLEVHDALGTIEQLPGIETVTLDVRGVYVRRPRAGARPIGLETPGSQYPLWMTPEADVDIFTQGPPKIWHIRTDGRTSYLVLGDFFQLEPGHYVARMRLQSKSAITPEVWWDSAPTGERIIAGEVVTPVRATNVSLRFTVPGTAAQYQQPLPVSEAGSGLFRLLLASGSPQPPTIELRVWVPQGALARAWWVSIERTGP